MESLEGVVESHAMEQNMKSDEIRRVGVGGNPWNPGKKKLFFFFFLVARTRISPLAVLPPRNSHETNPNLYP